MEGIKFRDFWHLVRMLCGSNTYVDVWNCTAKWIINGIHEDEFIDKLTDKQKEALEKLKDYVIYTVNGGAINVSGCYQLDEKALSILKEVLSTKDEEIIDTMIEAISEVDEKEIIEKAEELIDLMAEGDYVIVRDSRLDYGCWDGCQGYHNVEYIVYHNNKYILTDNGLGHHVYSNAEGYTVLKELTRDEAIKYLAEYIKQICERYNYTKLELEDYTIDSELDDAKLLFCEKHKKFYFDYEECYDCYIEHTEGK